MLSLLDNDDETYYEHLSPEKRLELDNHRSRAILRHLHRFALVCEHDYLLASHYHTILATTIRLHNDRRTSHLIIPRPINFSQRHSH